MERRNKLLVEKLMKMEGRGEYRKIYIDSD